MDEKTLDTLEYHKILEKLAGYTSFSASDELARAQRPTGDLLVARRRLAETAEARRLFELRPTITIGGAHDIRSQAEAAARGVVLTIPDLLDIKATLISARKLTRLFERLEQKFLYLTEISLRIPPPLGLIDAISQVISERGEIDDNASPQLAQIRRDLRVVHDRLLSRMQRMLTNPKITPYLQDNLVTQRDGRYVIPLQTEFKGKVKAVVHDQSSSGATLFVEPLVVVDLNNQYRELQLAERGEERRILAELSNRIGQRVSDLRLMVENIAELNLIFARAKYAEDLKASEPRLKEIPNSEKGPHPGSAIRLLQARHPLLAPETVVPIDIVLDPKTYALIITGPNTGGKTVTLKTVGLLALMAQSGLHIPVDPGSEISAFKDIYADIGDEQSIEQSLSTFSAHITNIIRILKGADNRSLVLLDELGSGTDPQDGAALAMAILAHILDRGITTLVATHYPELKTFALSKEGVVNASVEFDIETLRPVYHLIIGLPGNSNALTIVERLGLSEVIIARARSGIHPDELRAEDLLTEIHQQRELTRNARVEAECIRAEAEEIHERLMTRLEDVEDERNEILGEARQESEDRLATLEEELHDLRRQLARAQQPLETIEEVEKKVAELKDEVAVLIERQPVDEPVQCFVRLGDKVRLRGMGSQGVVSVIDGEVAEIRIGAMRVRTRLNELELVHREPVSVSGLPSPVDDQKSMIRWPSSPGIELHLRGMRVDEAMEILETYLDNAFLAQLPWVRIVHGKGTGRLRDAVRDSLHKHPYIKSYEPGRDGEGGGGVTVAKFQS